ncbi:MAG: anti-sigma regulatory factor [Desulfobulbaceae bacterium]|nr:anti-sigma regulatory factor [Desulfobulbaceae bacterium]MCK5339559.1 anti-sigma regulatory factor [Desulfobulbaceae bacterium]MCK5405541.1 anti-sigma regulatory factor [Desulfobulbaceae bacterium]
MRIEITSDDDIVTSRTMAKDLAQKLGFGIVDQTKIATAISELTRNVVKYADEGILNIETVSQAGRVGIELICEDRGPGIEDIEQAMQEGYSTGKGLGMGLCGAKKLMDEFEVTSEKGKGLRVTVRKWL